MELRKYHSKVSSEVYFNDIDSVYVVTCDVPSSKYLSVKTGIFCNIVQFNNVRTCMSQA